MEIYDFKIDGQIAPLGLDRKNPSFSWKMQSAEVNTLQEAYILKVSEAESGKECWNTGKRNSDQSLMVEYQGESLQPEKEYQMEVTVFDNHGNSDTVCGSFTTGIFDTETFSAQMITHDLPAEETACPVFCKNFLTVEGKKVKRALVYVTAQGVYELSLNGQRVGDYCMAPGWTSYHKHLQYQIFDVTELLNNLPENTGAAPSEQEKKISARDNLLEMTVANGWFKGYLGFTVQPNNYGDRVAAFLELHVDYEDGSRQVVTTDESWSVKTGEIRYSEIYMGETIDTDQPEIAEGSCQAVPFDKKILCAQENEPVRITDRLPAKKKIITPKGEILMDFGQNVTGVAEVHIHGSKGQKVIIRHAETLDKDGNFYPDTLRQAKSIDTFICNGEDQIFRPHFTFHGFRYISVEGIEDPQPEDFTACCLHSDLKKTGTYHCDNPKVNQLISNVWWGQVDNFLDIPTDCPQRDERLGWTGDAQIFSWTASFNADTSRFFKKWMHDVREESSLELGVPHVVPDILKSYSSSAWSDVAVIVPWVVYQTYGDTEILRDNWKCMHEWVDYIHNHTEENGLWMSGFQYGDWLALDKEESADRTGATDKFMIANAYYIYCTDLVKQTAEALGYTEEADKYAALYEKTLEAFREEYYTVTGRIVSETQTGAILSLYFNLAREKDRSRILNTLVTNLENHKSHLATGFVGTPYLCHALSENGAQEMAATVFMKEDYPSWLYAVNMGATTIWERWNSIMPDGSFDVSGMNSLNHYAYGSIADWLYRKSAGINQLLPGYKRIKIAPMFIQGIEEWGAELESVYGKIVSKWSCSDGKIRGYAEIPANTTAVIVLPEKEEQPEVGSGTYTWEYETTTILRKDRFTMDSTFGEIAAQPLALQMFNQAVPGMMDTPMIQYAFPMTLSEMLSQAPDARPLYEAVVAALNQQERENLKAMAEKN